MATKSFDQDMYNLLYETFADYISVSTQIYRLNIFSPIVNNDIGPLIKTIVYLINKYQIPVIVFFQMIDKACSYNRKYTRIYWELFSKLQDEYNFTKFENFEFSALFCALIFYKYGQRNDRLTQTIRDDEEFDKILNVFEEKTLMHAILNDDVDSFKKLVNKDELDEHDLMDDVLELPWFIPFIDNSIADWCCQLGAEKCFTFCSENGVKVSKEHLKLAFLGGNKKLIDMIISKIGGDNLKDVPFTHHIIINHEINYQKKFYDRRYSFEGIAECHDLLLFIYKLCETKDFNSALLYCVPFGILPLAQYLIDQGANARDKSGASALYYCAMHGNVEIARLLIQKGADVNANTARGLSEADIVAKTKNVEIKNFMLMGGGSPLDFCAKFDSDDVAKLLIGRRVDLKGKNEKGRPTIHIAAMYNSSEVLKLLLNHGVDVNMTNKKGSTVLHIAAKHNSVDVAKILLSSGANIKLLNKKGKTALHKTAKNSAVDVAKLLIQKGINVNTKTTDGYSALQLAVIHNSDALTALLVENVADMNIVDSNKRNLIHLCVLYDCNEILNFLVLQNLNLNAKDIEGKTPLMAAILCEKDRSFVAKTLIIQGCDVNIVAKDGSTALHLCAKHNKIEIAQAILEKGVDKEVKDANGKTAEQLARENKFNELAEMISNFVDPNEAENNADGELDDF